MADIDLNLGFNSYCKCRKRVLDYSNEDMNLLLENDKQVYLAVIDIPTGSIVKNCESRTLALIYGLNTHIYQSDGTFITDLDKDKQVMKAMQSFFISMPQVLNVMTKCINSEYYYSSNYRVYVKTAQGILFKELTDSSKEDRFIKMLIDNILYEIAKCK